MYIYFVLFTDIFKSINVFGLFNLKHNVCVHIFVEDAVCFLQTIEANLDLLEQLFDVQKDLEDFMEDILPNFRINCTQAYCLVVSSWLVIFILAQFIKSIVWEELSHYSAHSSANIRY